MFPMFHKPAAWAPSLPLSRSHLNELILNLPLVQPFTSRLADVLTMGFAWSKQVVPYVPCNKPPPSIFGVQCHPRADAVCAELDSFFLKNWPWKTQKDKDRFFASQANRWSCYAFCMADDDRLVDTTKMNTVLFLLDGMSRSSYSAWMLLMFFVRCGRGHESRRGQGILQEVDSACHGQKAPESQRSL